HTTPEGQEPWHFISQAGYPYEQAAENLAYGFDNSQDTIHGWLASPEHRTNLLNEAYTEVGFGVAQAENYQGNGSETVVVAMYGRPAAAGQPGAVLGETTGLQEITKTISKAQTLTNGQLPWIGFLLGLAIGGAVIYLIVKHSVAIHRAIRRGERFVL